MERAMRRSRIACIDILNITVEIRRQPQTSDRQDERAARIAQRRELRRAIAQEQSVAHTRWMTRG